MPMLSTPMTDATITYIHPGGTLDNQCWTVSTHPSPALRPREPSP